VPFDTTSFIFVSGFGDNILSITLSAIITLALLSSISPDQPSFGLAMICICMLVAQPKTLSVYIGVAGWG
jgi:uncharacterized membrane protein YgaE (UPF0421/DUF939 family)